jgi:hypothetical protein
MVETIQLAGDECAVAQFAHPLGEDADLHAHRPDMVRVAHVEPTTTTTAKRVQIGDGSFAEHGRHSRSGLLAPAACQLRGDEIPDRGNNQGIKHLVDIAPSRVAGNYV